jgi:Sulfotransferase family
VIFLVGCIRSGTTWLQRLLASHPRIQTGQESYLFARYVGRELRRWNLESKQDSVRPRPVGMRCWLTDEEFRKDLKRHLMDLMRPMVVGLGEDGLFLEKTPDHALWLPEIREMLPDCRIIHIVRDPRDVVASILAASKDFAFGFPKTTRDAAIHWKKIVTAVRESSSKLSMEQFYEIRYEDLAYQTLPTLSALSRFLRIRWPEDAMDAAVKNNQVNNRLNWTAIPLKGELGKTRPVAIEPEGFVRSGEKGTWRSQLSAGQKFEIWRLIRGEMRDFGYEWRHPW